MHLPEFVRKNKANRILLRIDGTFLKCAERLIEVNGDWIGVERLENIAKNRPFLQVL